VDCLQILQELLKSGTAQFLPAFFRAVRGQELSGARLKEFLQDLKAVHSPDKE